MIFRLFRGSANRRTVERLHGDIVAAVRQPAFFVDYAVADTFDGRFELLALLSTLVVRRLARLPAPGPDIAQELTDKVFQSLDDDLREMGVGDLAVPKRIKKLAAALLGRRKAYDEALESADPTALFVALARNVHANGLAPDDPRTPRLGRYVRAAESALSVTSLETLINGPTPFPAAADIA